MLSAVISSILSYGTAAGATQSPWYVIGPLVGTAPLNSSTPMADRDRTVSRRSEPSSRTTLIGEQPNPWDLLQPQDVMSRHRGAKHPRRYGPWRVSACYPAYLYPLSDGPSSEHGSYDRLSTLLDFSLASGSLCHCTLRTISDRSEHHLRTPPLLLGGDRPSQTTHIQCLAAGLRQAVRYPRIIREVFH